jgi:hypothetical protein
MRSAIRLLRSNASIGKDATVSIAFDQERS